MKTFVQINCFNNEKALVRTADIVGVKQLPSTTEKLYDELGNVVSETPNPTTFQVLVKGERGSTLVLNVDENEYNSLANTLLKE